MWKLYRDDETEQDEHDSNSCKFCVMNETYSVEMLLENS
jgi:hypothetical protein